jgi:2-(1,2-epoxy-1,2-dihydrophenyl)acetyl-CoA isomerase
MLVLVRRGASARVVFCRVLSVFFHLAVAAGRRSIFARGQIVETQLIPFRNSRLVITNGVAEFTHLRPDIRNALSGELRLDYADMLDRVEQERDIRVLVITGSGGSFCAGGDLKSLNALHASGDPAARSPDAMRRRLQTMHVWLRRLRNLDIPVIAAVDGPAAGAGFSLSLAADFILASTRAFFCMSFARVGLLPDLGALYELPRIVGVSLAKELAFTARRLTAEEAQRHGIVHSTHTPEALMEEVRRFARRLSAGPREATGLTKRMLNSTFDLSYDVALEMEAHAQALATAAPFHAEAVAAFQRGEPARFDWERGAGE